jgi:hypothetical protein
MNSETISELNFSICESTKQQIQNQMVVFDGNKSLYLVFVGVVFSSAS